MQEKYNATQISKVIDQSLVYQCACPAQVCRTIFELRELFEYQINCANNSANDRLVHETIATATAQAHAVMEECLSKVLEIEGWDSASLIMPESLRKKPAKPI
ncbi:MAG TPA: hypothetical protein VIE91_05615 [Methylophilaceae bacterium]|jgi:hypothetical protein